MRLAVEKLIELAPKNFTEDTVSRKNILSALYQNILPSYEGREAYFQTVSLINALEDLGYPNFGGQGHYRMIAQGHITTHFSENMYWYDNPKNLKKKLESAYVLLSKDNLDPRIKIFAQNLEMECIPGCISKIANLLLLASVNDGSSFLSNFKEQFIQDCIVKNYKEVLNLIPLHGLRVEDAFEVHNVAGILNALSTIFNINKSEDPTPTINIQEIVVSEFVDKVSEAIYDLTPENIIDSLTQFFLFKVGLEQHPSVQDLNNQMLSSMKDFMKDEIEIQMDLFFTENYQEVRNNYQERVKGYVTLYLSELGYILDVDQEQLKNEIGIEDNLTIQVEQPSAEFLDAVRAANERRAEHMRRQAAILAEEERQNLANMPVLIEMTNEQERELLPALNQVEREDFIPLTNPTRPVGGFHRVATLYNTSNNRGNAELPDFETNTTSIRVVERTAVERSSYTISHEIFHQEETNVENSVLNNDETELNREEIDTGEYQEEETAYREEVEGAPLIRLVDDKSHEVSVLRSDSGNNLYLVDKKTYQEDEIVKVSGSQSTLVRVKPDEVPQNVFSNVKKIVEDPASLDLVTKVLIKVVFESPKYFSNTNIDTVQDRIEETIRQDTDFSQNGCELMAFLICNDLMLTA